ncbi:transposase family protein [Streptomyces sp. NPDC004059]
MIFQISRPDDLRVVVRVSVSSLTDPVLDQLADLALWEAELAAEPVEVESALLRRLAQVPDRRARRGLRHPLVVVLVLTACAMLVVGGDCVAAIWQWAARSPRASYPIAGPDGRLTPDCASKTIASRPGRRGKVTGVPRRRRC